MTPETRTTISAISDSSACAECGAPATGNFCTACGADLRDSASGTLGALTGRVRQSFPVVYLKLLRSPVKAAVALAEDPSYRGHGSFVLTGLAFYALFLIPIFQQMVAGEGAQFSPSQQTWITILAHVGLYVGVAFTFAFGYALFRFSSKEPRRLHGYFKLYCIAWGFVAPISGIYEYVARTLLGGTGISSFSGPMTPEQWRTPSAAISIVLSLVLLAYIIAIHRRFWRMPWWKAAPLYLIAMITANQLVSWLMFYVGYWMTNMLVSFGLVSAFHP